MSAASRPYVPSMSDAPVKARTGRDWAAWFATLDRAGAQKLPHREIAHLLAARHRVPSGWSQMVAVEYERARGLRVRHQSADGFYAKGRAKSQIAVQVSRLAKKGDVEPVRRSWKAALARLQSLLEE